MATILLIDHDEAQTKTLGSALEAEGHHVLLVEAGSDGLRQARSEAPACIILAVELGHTSGYSICNKLKRDRELASIPLLLSSSQASAETFAEHSRLRTHAEAYVHKPYDVASVASTVRSLVEGAGAPAATSKEPSHAGTAPVKPARFGEEPSAHDMRAAPFLLEGAASGEPAASTKAEPQLTTDAQLLLESAVDAQLSTRVFDNFVLGQPQQGSASPAELIVEALGDIDQAAAHGRAAETALRGSPEPGTTLELPIEATPSGGHGAGTGSAFETGLVDALRARITDLERRLAVQAAPAEQLGATDIAEDPTLPARLEALEQRCTAAEAARDEALAQLEAQRRTLGQIRGLLQHVSRS